MMKENSTVNMTANTEEKKKGILHEFWNTPYPEFILHAFQWMFWPLEEKAGRKELSDSKYLKLEMIIILAMIAAVILLTGVFNPLDLFFDVPYLSADSFLESISNYNNYTWATYFAISGTLSMIVLYFVQAFVFRGKNYRMTSLQGVLFAVMAVLITLVCDILFQEPFRVFHETCIIDNIMAPWNLAAYLLANVTVYYVLCDAFTSVLSFSITPVLCKYLGFNLFSLGLVHFIVLALVLKVVMAFINKLGIWELIVGFIAKWIYTPKYLFRIIFFIYFFMIIIPVRLAFPDFYTKVKARFFK